MGRAREIADLIGGTTPDIILKTSDGAILNLQTSDTTVTSSSVLGAINFQAPDEASGTDAILLGAGIDAVAEGTFSASSNATKLSFKTASSAAASETMSLSSAGLLTISDDLVIGDGKTIGSATTPAAITIASNGLVTISRSDNAENLSLVSTDADASVGPTLRLDRQSASAADGDLLGKINFVGHNDAGTPEDIAYAGITAIINDASDGTEDGKLAINTIVAGTERSRVFIDASETVFNEDSIDLDFRVESNGLTNAFMVDGGNNGIGFGHSPRSDLHTSWVQSFFGTEGSIISQRDSGGGIPGMSVTSNTYVDSDTGGYAYMTTNEATKLDLKDGVITFNGAAAGTAGNAISFTEYARFDTSGRLGVGTTSPTNFLEVSAGAPTIALTSPSQASDKKTTRIASSQFTAGDFVIQQMDDDGTIGATPFLLDANDDVGIGTTSPGGVRLFVSKSQSTGSNVAQISNGTSSGNVFCFGTSINSNGNNTSSFHVRSVTQQVGTFGLLGNGTQSFTSDRRLKKNIETTRDGYLEDLAKLRVVKYNWHNHDDGTPKELGLIAQEVQEVFPNLVRTDDEELNGITDPKSLKMSVIPFMVLKALQEATARIQTLESKVKTLEGG